MSLAGLRAAETLRRDGFDGRVVAIGAEPRLPYDRPPLSKDYLAGTCEADDISLRRDGVDDLDLEWHLGRRATALDLHSRKLHLDDGTSIAYDGLVIATGSTARRLPAHPDLEGVFTLRTLDDAHALRSRLETAPKVVVIGAGFIGAEVAATCRERGLDVTILESLPHPMVRGLGPALGDVIAAVHRDHGVDLRTSAHVKGIDGAARVERIRLGDGSTLEADLVVVGIGVVPETRWLQDSGLRLDDGIVCDETGLAAPGVVAAGDVARWPNPLFDGEMMRLEHWTNATEQGVHAAKRLLAGERGEPFAPVPFVWSDQYDRKIQAVGRVAGDAHVHVAHGTLDDRQFVALFGRNERIIGALGFNRPRQVMQYRKLIAERASWETALAHSRVNMPTSSASLLTRRFVIVVASGLAYFLALAMLTPVIPHYVEDELGQGKLAVGVAVGSFAFGAIALRPYAGRIGDRTGRRVLIVGGALIVAMSTALYGIVPALWWLVLTRIVTGVGEAAFFVGAATMITDLSPVERRGEAVSYWSVAVYGGLAFGPALGELVRGESRYTLAWLVSATLALLAALLGLATREVERAVVREPTHLINRAALLPGTVLFLGLIPLAGFSAFMPLYVDDRLDIEAGPVFLVYGVLILIVRIAGARLPDRLGGRRAGTIALTFAALGIGIIAAWASVAGLIVGTIVLAIGMSFLYPALLLLALQRASEDDRASVVATVSSFFDLSQGVGAFICGAVAALTGNRGAFAAGAVAAVCGLVLLRSGTARQQWAPPPTDDLDIPAPMTHE